MRTIIFLLLAAISSFSFGQEASGVTVTVTIPNLTNNDGAASASLYTEGTFMKAAPLETQSATPENKTVTLVFENVKPGEYGIITLHDMNGNNRMDFNANGMPKEDYGISGGSTSFGPPTWNDAKFTVGSEDLELEIKM